MTYVSNDKYEITIGDQTILASAEELREAFLEIKKYENDDFNDFIETCPYNYIYEDSARFELLRREIRDDGYKNVKWSDDMANILETAVETGMETAHNWYTSQYHMVRKI